MVGTSPTLLFSAYFDALSLDEAAILNFPQGLPGFETEHSFAAVQIPDQKPLVYLQSVATPELCLLAFPITAIDPGFQLELSSDDCLVLHLAEERPYPNLITLAIVAVEPAAGATANCAAPLVVNPRNCIGVQSLQPANSLRYDYPLSVSLNAC